MTNKLAKCFKGSVLLTYFFVRNLKKLPPEIEIAIHGYGLTSVVLGFHWLFLFSGLNLKKKLTDFEKINVLSSLV